MKVRFILFSLFLSICFIGHAADAAKMETRRFEVLPTLSYVIGEHADPDHAERSGEDTFMETADMDKPADFKAFFSDLGVTWPEGSKVSYMATIGKLEITNTPVNTERVKDILILANLIPCMIEIQVDFIEYDLKDIEKLVINNRIDRDTLMALWQEGKGQLLSSGKTVTKSDQECVVKGVTEYLYPTEFNVLPRLANGKPERSAPVATVEPQNFEMREVGNLLQVVAEMNRPSGYINILLNPQHICTPAWKNYSIPHNAKNNGAGQPPTEQPFVHVYSVSTQVTVANGSTILLGGGMKNAAGDTSVYIFLTAKLIDPKSTPIIKPDINIYQTAESDVTSNNMETHYIKIAPSLSDGLTVKRSEIYGKDNDKYDHEKEMKDFFVDHGVEWPKGSKVQHIKSMNYIKITNTPDNILKFKQALHKIGSTSIQIETRVDFVEYNLDDIDKLAISNGVNQSSLLQLWQAEKGRLLSSSCVLTKGGQEAIVKGVTEYIYPAEFKVKTCISSNEPNAVIISPTVEPVNFEMREVGNILQVVPEYRPDIQRVNMLLNPKLVSPPEWKNYGFALKTGSLPMEQPLFHAYSVSTQTQVSNGTTTLIGGGMNNESGDKTVYAFLSVSLLDTEGNHIILPEPEEESDPDKLDDNKLVTRIFDVLSTLNDRISSAADELNDSKTNNTFMTTADLAENQDWKSFFAEMGVAWPEGSSLEYIPQSGKLIVKNTQLQIHTFKQIMSDGIDEARLIHIKTEFVEYGIDDIDKLANQGKITQESLRKLWENGKGKLLCTPVVLTKSGQEAIVRGVTEYSYPTEFEIKTALTPSGSVDVAEPQDFEMREVGNILQVVPEISAEGNFINLLLNPQLIETPEWKQYGNGRNLNMQQPFFHAYSVSTQISVKNGETVLLGGGMNSKTGDKIVYIFVKAEIVDAKGEPQS